MKISKPRLICRMFRKIKAQKQSRIFLNFSIFECVDKADKFNSSHFKIYNFRFPKESTKCLKLIRRRSSRSATCSSSSFCEKTDSTKFQKSLKESQNHRVTIKLNHILLFSHKLSDLLHEIKSK
jgi:hypothetical protein